MARDLFNDLDDVFASVANYEEEGRLAGMNGLR